MCGGSPLSPILAFASAKNVPRDIRLIANPLVSHHVSEDIVTELERTMLSDPSVRAAQGDCLGARILGAAIWRPCDSVMTISPFSWVLGSGNVRPISPLRGGATSTF